MGKCSQTRKRFLKNDESNKRGNPSVSVRSNSGESWNNDLGVTDTMPTLVFELFLGSLRDVRLLKICRLVCQSWNIEACKSLRACSKVCIVEGSSRLENFRTLVLQKAIGPLQHLPSPFQNFHVEGQTLTDPTFIGFFLKIPVTSLVVDLELVNGRQLSSFLVANQTSLTDLEINASEFNYFEVDQYKINNSIGLTYLKRLTMKDFCNSCTHIQLVAGILSRCNPECLDLFISNKDAIACLLPPDKAGNLKTLKLHVAEISREAWKHLGNLRCLGLKSLSFWLDDSIDEPDDLQQWALFCQNVFPLLEVFVTNLPISFAPDLIFPKLKSIQIVDNIMWSYFTPDRFPSLETVILRFVRLLSIKVQNEVPHRGVSSLDLRIVDFYNENVELVSENLMHLLTYASRQFPEVSSLTLALRKFRHNSLPDIFESFPKLRTLSLDGKCDFSCLSGMNESVVTEYLEQGLPIERIPRRKSITDFVELETIKFGRVFVMDPLILRYCLPRVPKLRQIYLYWNTSLSAPLLRDFIGHLDRIVICNHAEDEFQVALAQVAEMVPNSVLG